jgi:hypothetical protein
MAAFSVDRPAAALSLFGTDLLIRRVVERVFEPLRHSGLKSAHADEAIE